MTRDDPLTALEHDTADERRRSGLQTRANKLKPKDAEHKAQTPAVERRKARREQAKETQPDWLHPENPEIWEGDI